MLRPLVHLVQLVQLALLVAQDTLGLKEQQDNLDHRANMGLRELQDILDRQALKVRLVHREPMVQLVRLEQQEALDHRDHQEIKVLRVHLDIILVHQDQLVPLANRDNQDLLGQLVQVVEQDLKDHKDRLVQVVLLVQLDIKDQLDQLVLLDIKDLLDLQVELVPLEAKDLLEVLEAREQLVLQEPLEHLVQQDSQVRVVLKALQDRLDLLGLQELRAALDRLAILAHQDLSQDLQDLQDPVGQQDHQVLQVLQVALVLKVVLVLVDGLVHWDFLDLLGQQVPLDSLEAQANLVTLVQQDQQGLQDLLVSLGHLAKYILDHLELREQQELRVPLEQLEVLDHKARLVLVEVRVQLEVPDQLVGQEQQDH